MKLLRTISLTACLATVTLSVHSQRYTHDPAAAAPQKQPDTFTDFALKQINPTNKDYGQAIEDARWLAIHETVENFYFWATLVSLLLLGYSFLNTFLESQNEQRREIVASVFLTWYHNELIRAGEMAADAIAKNNQLSKAIDDEAEARLVKKPRVLKPDSAPALPAPEANSGGGPVQSSPIISDREVITENNRLRQTLAIKDTTEKAYRQKIGDLNRRLEEEQQKNRKYKDD